MTEAPVISSRMCRSVEDLLLQPESKRVLCYMCARYGAGYGCRSVRVAARNQNVGRICPFNACQA